MGQSPIFKMCLGGCFLKCLVYARQTPFFGAQKKRLSFEKRLISLCFLLSGVGQQRDGTGALDGLGKLTLMLGAVAAHTAGHDLAALVDVAAHTGS